MKRSTKAALISGLVFPGLGHLYLKHFIPGLILLVGSAVAGYVVVSNAVDTANVVAAKIQEGGVALDVAAISQLVEQQSHANGDTTNVATTAFFVFWLIGILDSIRVGRKLEKTKGVAQKQET